MTQLDSIFLNNKLNFDIEEIDIKEIKYLDENLDTDINNISKIDTNDIDDIDDVINLNTESDNLDHDESFDENLDEKSLILEFENFIESIESVESVESVETIMSKSNYILYNLDGTRLYLSKDEVFYDSDKQENRQYYLISDNTLLFQDIEMISKFIKKNI